MGEEQESRDKKIRFILERFIQDTPGELLMKTIGIISLASSCTFIFMTQTDWAIVDPCCGSWV